MAKRFIDTGIFDDEWFSSLSPGGKLSWLYLITKCDHAGIISINKSLFKFQTGQNWETVSKELGKSIVTLKTGKIFMPKFIDFQYPNFPKSKAPQQFGAIEILKKNFLWDEKNERVTIELSNSNGNGNGNGSGNGEGNGITPKELKPKKSFMPPTIDQVIAFFKENGFSEAIATSAWNYYNDGDWKDSLGHRVRSWKQKMRGVWFKNENKDINPKKSQTTTQNDGF